MPFSVSYWQPWIYFQTLGTYPFWTFYINGIRLCALCVCLLSLSIMFSRFSIFLFMAEKYSIIWIYHILFIHLTVDEHLVCFHLLVIMNNASTMGIQIFESLLLLLFGIYISRSRIVGFYGNVYVEFFWGTIMPFSAAAASFHIPSSHTQGFQFLHILVAWVCLSPMTSDVGPLFMFAFIFQQRIWKTS